MSLEASKGVVPLDADPVEPGACVGETLRPQGVQGPAARRPAGDQPGAVEDGEMLGHRLSAEAAARRQRHDRPRRAVGEMLDQRQPGRIGERGEERSLSLRHGP